MAIRIGNYTFDTIEEVKKAKEDGLIQGDLITKNDPPSATPTATPAYGTWANGTQAGPLSVPGIRADMFSTYMRPNSLVSIAGIERSQNTNEKIGILTGLTEGSGANADSFCENDPPIAGQLKRCVQNYIWGKFYMRTKLVNLPEMGERWDTSDVDKTILNLAATTNPLVPQELASANLSNRGNTVMATALFEMAGEVERSMANVEITGDQTQASANTERGFMKEFDGLARQVVTGRRDLDSQVLCPAADSTVINFGVNISGTAADGRTIVQQMTDEYFYKQELAQRIGMTGTMFAFVMRSTFFRALTYIWACEYAISRCSGTAGNPNWQNATDVKALQLEMLRGRYLLVDNEPVPVIFSDGVPNVRALGSVFTTDAYLIPVAWRGRRLLHFQYKPMDISEIEGFANFAGLRTYETINGGMYLVGNQHQGGCLEWLFMAKFRMILDAPFLAIAWNNVQYTLSAQAYRDPMPSDTTFHKDGGTTYTQF